MKYWTIKVFITGRNKNVITEWLQKLPTGAQVEIERRLKYLETQESWARPYSAKRKGGDGNLYEIRITWKKQQYRPLGFFGPKRGDFTLLVGAQEKGSKLVPRKADDIAEKRRQLIIKDESHARKYFGE